MAYILLWVLVKVFLFMVDFVSDVLRRVSEEFGVSLNVVERFRRIVGREGLDYFLVSDDGLVVDEDFLSFLNGSRVDVDGLASKYGLDRVLWLI